VTFALGKCQGDERNKQQYLKQRWLKNFTPIIVTHQVTDPRISENSMQDKCQQKTPRDIIKSQKSKIKQVSWKKSDEKTPKWGAELHLTSQKPCRQAERVGECLKCWGESITNLEFCASWRFPSEAKETNRMGKFPACTPALQEMLEVL
jgi:hypothetical protein